VFSTNTVTVFTYHLLSLISYNNSIPLLSPIDIYPNSPCGGARGYEWGYRKGKMNIGGVLPNSESLLNVQVVRHGMAFRAPDVPGATAKTDGATV
jgi:hypothetical protein